jgi:4-amino-4-deoxy-L-arabinose transferase-like glycosyltransferase
LVVLAITTFIIQFAGVALLAGLSSPTSPSSDDHEYDLYAWNLAQGRGYRGPSVDVEDQDHFTAYRPPTAPLYYAAIYFIFGHHYPAAHVANCLLIAATVLLLYAVTRCCFGRTAAGVAAVLYAFYPIALYYNLVLVSETLANFLTVLFVWSSLSITGARGAWWAVASGLVFGALLLCKPGVVFLVPLLPVWGWVVCRRDRRLWLRAALVPLCACLVMMPWVVRNRIVLGAFIPFGTSGGQLLLSGNNRVVVEDPRLAGYSVMDNALPEFQKQLRAPNDEIRRDATAKRLALDWLWNNPDKWFYLLQGKFFRLWAPHYFGTEHRALAPILLGYYGIVLVLFLAGLGPITRRFFDERHPAIVMQLLILALTATALVFHGQHRYRFTIDPFLTSFAGATLAWSWVVIRRKQYAAVWATVAAFVRRHRLATGLSVLAFAALTAAWKADQNHIEAYRARVCEAKIQAIAQGVRAYHAAEGRWPTSVTELVPRFLANLDCLHCPKHSVGWHDYQFLGCREPKQAAHLISYRLQIGPGEEVRVEEIAAEHFGERHDVTVAP